MPPKIPITRARVLDAALSLVNERGAAALTMRALATELDIEAPSLYKHIENKDEILDGLCELVYGQVTVGDVGDDWRDRLKAYAGAYRQALLQNRNVAPILAVRPVATEGSMLLVEASLAEFVRGGVDPETGRRLLNIIAGFVVGHVLAEVADPAPGTEQDRLAEIRAKLNPSLYPLTLATLGTSVADRDAEFDLALELLIDAITVHYAEELARASSVAN
ncbi:MAG: TetR/AcrR family transcriptional regulator C-terminal domain-containing protein [Acidimicrobiia bacterium]|nr:TetR/AcrR family transcriptional regulator C-terminal domain-containing protein [Acidimicrobiia bacterium]